MSGRLDQLLPPTAETDPREILRWVRKAEIVMGIVLLVAAIAFWDRLGWLHWVLIVLGLSGLSPWPGARSILNKAERDPDVLIWDPARRREGGRRAVIVAALALVLIMGVVGFLLDGWKAAIFMATLGGVAAAIGVWTTLRGARDT